MYLIVVDFKASCIFRIYLAFGTLGDFSVFFYFIFVRPEQGTTQHTQRCKALGNAHEGQIWKDFAMGRCLIRDWRISSLLEGIARVIFVHCCVA